MTAGAIARALDAARAARPGLAGDTSLVQARLQAHLDAGDPLDGLHLGDLWLAAACAAGERAALGAFEAELVPDMQRALAKLGVTGAAAEEVTQRVRQRLLVSDGDTPPRIATYSGRGPLRGWLRAVVAHEAMSAHRRAQPVQEMDSTLAELAGDDDPELAQIKARFAAPFRDAFRDALAALPSRDRNVLRLVYIEGLAVEQVATVYGVHRVSVSRWLGHTRRALLDGTRSRMAERLNLDVSDMASITRLCLSQIDVSLDRLLEAR